MDPELYNLLLTLFGDDLTITMEEAMNLYDEYGVYDHLDTINTLIQMADDTDHMELHDAMYSIIDDTAESILNEHGIELNDSVQLRYKVELLDSIKNLQTLIDYTEAYNLLESEQPDMEIFANLVEMTSMLDTTTVYDIVHILNPQFIDSLKYLIKKKVEVSEESLVGDMQLKRKIIDKLKKYNTFVKGKVTCGYSLMEQGALIGEKFEMYLPYITEYITIDDADSIAETLYTTLLLSNDGYVNPLLIFKKYIDKIPVVDETMVSKIESAIEKVASNFDTYVKATTSERF